MNNESFLPGWEVEIGYSGVLDKEDCPPDQPIRMFKYVAGEKTNQGYGNRREVYLTVEELTRIAKDTTKEILQNGVKERGGFNLRKRLEDSDIQEKITNFLEENKLKENEKILEGPGVVLRLSGEFNSDLLSEKTNPNDLLVVNSILETYEVVDSESGEKTGEIQGPLKDVFKAGSLKELSE